MIKYFVLIFLIFCSVEAFSETILNGKIKDGTTDQPISNISITVGSEKLSHKSDKQGNFTLKFAENGNYDIVFSGMGYEAVSKTILAEGKTLEIEISMNPKPVEYSELLVYGASRRPEKITESPAAVTAVFSEELARKSRQGQIANALSGSVGVDILRNGATDYIVNTRGFNGGLNRRLLVLQDGRDVAMPLLGALEWNSFAMPQEDFESVELVRGPGAALYGANAFNGVLLMKSAAPRDILGTKVSLLGGDYETIKADVRHAGVLGDFSYKVSLGHSQMLNLINRRDSLKFLEYNGLPLEKKVLTDDDRQTFSNYGTIRVDYNFDNNSYLSSEFGYSRSGNEAYVFGLGRTFVKDVERPYLRLAYNSNNINIHAHYMSRFVPDSMWLMVPNAPLLDNSKDMMIDFQHNFNIAEDLHFIWGITEQIQNIRTYGTSIPFDVDADFTGVYAQLNWQMNDKLKFVASSRFDYASIHTSYFSPRFSVVYSPIASQKFRLSINKAFQRPNYSELYRLTPDAPAFSASTGKPVNFAALQGAIADSIAKLSGVRPTLNLNLNPTRAKAIGNEDLEVEKILALEFGYKGTFGSNLFVSVDAYYNRLNDFITTFLPGVNSKIPAWSPSMPDSLLAYSTLVKNMVMSALSPRDQQRLSIYNGEPTFVISNANVGIVDEYGVEIEAVYQLFTNLSVKADYSYFGYKVVENESSQPLLPNTSPHRLGFGANYIYPNFFDVGISINYSEKFDWLAGVYRGTVPAYAVVNLNGGIYLVDNLSVGLNIYNLLNRRHYQIFGGTYLPRMATLRLSYEF